MSQPHQCWTGDEDGADPEECTGNPYDCQCPRCREWLIDVAADRAYEAA